MGLALDELANNREQLLEADGLSIMMDERVRGYLESVPSITVDYIKTRLGSGFVIEGLSTC